jgi:hypothetical protein
MQLVVPEAQFEFTHALLWHDEPIGQTVPQPPQLVESTVVSTQPASPHTVWFIVQPPVHLPPLQLAPVPQVAPHRPQFAGSVITSTQVSKQFTCGAVQVASHAAELPATSSAARRSQTIDSRRKVTAEA